MVSRGQKIALAAALLIGAFIASYYTYVLRQEELREWRVVQVAFADVGGLETKDPVMLNGAPMGRVKAIRLFEDRSLVTLEIDPVVRLKKDVAIEAVPTSALGSMGIEINISSRVFNTNLLQLAGYDKTQVPALVAALGGVRRGGISAKVLKAAGYDYTDAKRLLTMLGDANAEDPGEVVRRTGLSEAKANELRALSRRAVIREITRRTTLTPAEAEALIEAASEPMPDAPGVLNGRVREALAGAPPGPGRRKELKTYLLDFARQLEELERPDSGPVGRLIFDSDRAAELDQALTDLDDSWRELDEGLAQIEQDASVNGFLSPESLIAADATAQAFNDTFAGLKDGLRAALRGEGTAGTFVGDRPFAEGWRDALVNQRRAWSRIRQGEGLVGGLVDPEAGLYDALGDTLSDLNTLSEDGVRGEGTLGLLSAPEFSEDSRQILRNLAGSLERLRKSPLIDNAQARQDVEDLLGDADDLLGNLRRGLKGIRRALPDRTFHGAVFSVF